MKLTAEISLYPLTEKYIEVIKAFIHAASQHDGVTLVTNAMSTQVSGDFDSVMHLVSREFKASFEKYGRQVLVCKFIPGELEIRQQ